MKLFKLLILIGLWYYYGIWAVIGYLGTIMAITGSYDLSCRYRAKRLPATHQKKGMYYDRTEQRLVGTVTNVHTDPYSGRQYLGKTINTNNEEL